MANALADSQISPKRPETSGRGFMLSDRKPSALSAGAVVAGIVICVSVIASETPAWQWMYQVWLSNPDNSHGLLVPIFAFALLWLRKELCPTVAGKVTRTAFTLGVALLVGGEAIKCAGIYCRMITLDAMSILPSLAGIVLCCGGWPAVRWAWPSVLFLGFMIPLPSSIGGLLGHALQHIATISSTYLMQLFGMPVISEGNLIFLSHTTLGVAQACSGIRMLISFFALTTALCFVVDRTVWQKLLIWLSAPLIAVLANVLRITATGIAYEFGNARLAELIFHDLAGWLMMPVGLMLLGVELFLLSRILPMGNRRDSRPIA